MKWILLLCALLCTANTCQAEQTPQQPQRIAPLYVATVRGGPLRRWAFGTYRVDPLYYRACTPVQVVPVQRYRWQLVPAR